MIAVVESRWKVCGYSLYFSFMLSFLSCLKLFKVKNLVGKTFCSFSTMEKSFVLLTIGFFSYACYNIKQNHIYPLNVSVYARNRPLKPKKREFPDGPVVRTPNAHC